MIRAAIFRALRIHGDVRAVRRGRYAQRVVKRRAHRELAAALRRWLP